MSKMLTGSIDLNKIDKSKIVTKDKNGNPFSNGAKYLNVIVWINEQADQYGNNASIQISQSKDERENKVKPTYIGNLKEYKSNNKPTNNEVTSEVSNDVDSLPF